MIVQLRHKKFTVGQYHHMIESGILTERDRVELLQGEIIEMPPIGAKHAACVDRLADLLFGALTGQAIVRVQSPIQLSHHSEPEPDLAILRRRDDFYAAGHPQVSDIFAVIEVADTTIEFDRRVKLPLYAQDGIPEVWLVDLNASVVELYRQPSQGEYQQVQVFSQQQSLTLQSFSALQFSVAQILG
ncbi:MAG: Uma2 family endonuclease [Spirulinaceae cyanobacterium]